MLQKVLLTIDSDETMTVSEVVRLLFVLDAINFMSASWKDVSEETMQNCFFCDLRLGIPDGSFLWFSLNEILLNFINESYQEYLSIDDGLEIAGCPTDAEICEELMQSRKEGGKDDTAENPTKAVSDLSPKSKEALASLDTIRWQFQFQGMNMDFYFKLEKCMLDSMFKHIKQTTIESYFKSK